jgi:hypothetical protein
VPQTKSQAETLSWINAVLRAQAYQHGFQNWGMPMSRRTTLWSSASLIAAMLFVMSIYAGLALADTKEVTCGNQWCKVTCNSVKASAFCEGNQEDAVLCACFGEKAGGSVEVKGCSGKKTHCEKDCVDGHPEGRCDPYAKCFC